MSEPFDSLRSLRAKRQGFPFEPLPRVEWRRRESNESPDSIEEIISKGVTNGSPAVGVIQEYSQFPAGRWLTITDARLVSVALHWLELPETVRTQMETLCIEGAS